MSNGTNPFDDAAAEAARLTNAELDARVSSLTRLTDAELRRLFPTKADKQRLVELLAIVNAATTENQKIVELRRNLERLGGVALRLIETLA